MVRSVLPESPVRPITPSTVQGPSDDPVSGETDISPMWNKSILGSTSKLTDSDLPCSDASKTSSLKSGVT